MSSSKPKLTLEDVIARLRARGASKAEISRRLGVSWTFVYSRLPPPERAPAQPDLPRDRRAANAVRAARGARTQLEALKRGETSE